MAQHTLLFYNGKFIIAKKENIKWSDKEKADPFEIIKTRDIAINEKSIKVKLKDKEVNLETSKIHPMYFEVEEI